MFVQDLRRGRYKKIGSCRGMSSALQRSRYVSWCGSAESPTPVTTVLTAGEAVSHQNHQPAGSRSVPLLLLSALHHSDKAPNSHGDKGENKDSEEGRPGNKDDRSLLHPDDKSFLLPRSSPVISRNPRPISWHGRGTNMSACSSLDSPAPASGSVTSMEDLGFQRSSCPHSSPLQEEKKPRSISLSSQLNRLLSAGLHLPFSGQQGLAEEHRGRGCDTPHSSGLSTPTQHSKERRCSGIPEFSADIFKTSSELEKENAHFIVVDMVLEVLEGVKWTLTSTMETHGSMCTCGHTSSAEDAPPHEHDQRYETCEHSHTCSTDDHEQHNNKHSHSDDDVKTSHTETHSSYVHTHQHTQDEEEEDAGNDRAEHQPKTFSVLSTDSGFEDCGVDATLTLKDSLRSAEWLAQHLVLEFRRSWLPSHGPRRGRQSLRSSLQELPGTGKVAVSSSSFAEEIRLRTRMRGSLSWAPPRFQIIFTIQPTHRRSEVVALQKFLCAGCGTEVEPKYIKKLRYCEYLGRYFCDCCHSGSEAVIPGRLLSSWDFGRYPVSDFSKQLLDSVCHQPLFDLTCVGKTLYSKVKELDKFRELQEQLLGIKKLLKACRFSGRVMTEFEQLPAHLTEQPHLFSMDDLLRVKKGQLVTQAKALLNSAIDHVENCNVGLKHCLCLARGFICEFCRERDVIFPFQSDICRRCPVCKACFHKQCFVEKKCPKCARIQSRKKRLDGSVN
ncbi:protein associated with UVRAG as autophagy enhancer isoform X1 [Micropterus dolomieu]|uniref:protein associated with UVRAG as autophagy enhancer isoform X1 n=1 Tax=Micropterus dolomieu TaxID=147949 RepID=UPI001E8CF27F|nr:protein associated with UVRAG as autophagy enhancer isoform X1 [Micropterus dolomieu]